jgi:CRISPR type III-B/RAMP module-associated protein Cmr5
MTLEQQRAKFALAKIDGVKSLPSAEKFKTQLLKLPARLHTSGLGQTVAFYLSAGPNAPETEICRWIGGWLREIDIYANDDLIRNIVGDRGAADDAERKYRMASSEARALSVWLKRFAEAFIGGGN